MKTSSKQYAAALYELVAGKNAAANKETIANFVQLLSKNRDLNKAEEIMRELIKIWERAEGELQAEITSARDLGREAKKLVMDYLKDKTGSEKIVLEEKIDKKILGGFILRYEGKIIDGSLRSNLENLKVRMEK